jgi:hypothetical protein
LGITAIWRFDVLAVEPPFVDAVSGLQPKVNIAAISQTTIGHRHDGLRFDSADSFEWETLGNTVMFNPIEFVGDEPML